MLINNYPLLSSHIIFFLKLDSKLINFKNEQRLLLNNFLSFLNFSAFIILQNHELGFF